MEDNIVFLDWKVFNSDNSYMFSCSRNAQLKIICFQIINILNIFKLKLFVRISKSHDRPNLLSQVAKAQSRAQWIAQCKFDFACISN